MRGAEALREGLASRELRLFVLACAAMSLALWSFTVVLAIAAYHAGGTGAVTLAVVARVLPGALAGPFAALLADRHSRRTMLLSFTGGATVALAALVVVSTLGGAFAFVLVLAACCSIFASGQQPAQAALLLSLAHNPRQLAVANSLRQGFGNAAYCVGALAGGAAAAGLSVAAGFTLALAASACGMLALSLLAADPRPAHREARAETSVAGELLLGLREVGAAPELRESVGVFGAIGLVYGVLDVLMVVVAVEYAGLGTGGVGILNSAWGAGGLIGGFAAAALLARGRFSSALMVGAGLIAAPLALIAAASHPIAAIVAIAVLGLGYAVGETASQTLVQRLGSDESLARTFGVAETGQQMAVASGSVLAPLLIAAFGIRGALLATALVAPVLVMVRRRALKRLDAKAVVPERQLQLLRAIDMFAPLPLATVETLAVRLLAQPVFAGDHVMRMGSAGRQFYVVAEGSFEVRAGTVSRRLAPGDYFGEIALLRDVPRSADVVAKMDGLLYALDREDFLLAVTGQVRSKQTAETVASARLLASGEPS